MEKGNKKMSTNIMKTIVTYIDRTGSITNEELAEFLKEFKDFVEESNA